MIAFVRGELAGITENSVILDCNGIGYELFVPGSVMNRLPSMGTTLQLTTYLQVKEDGISLFGFSNQEELQIFRLLIGVNGIGPKGAIGILSALSVDDLRFAVLAEDEKTIARAPGIGAKTAKKLILELKDKFDLADAFEKKLAGTQNVEQGARQAVNAVTSEAMQALVALGFSGTDANRAVSSVTVEEGMTTDDVLKLALKAIRS